MVGAVNLYRSYLGSILSIKVNHTGLAYGRAMTCSWVKYITGSKLAEPWVN